MYFNRFTIFPDWRVYPYPFDCNLDLFVFIFLPLVRQINHLNNKKKNKINHFQIEQKLISARSNVEPFFSSQTINNFDSIILNSQTISNHPFHFNSFQFTRHTNKMLNSTSSHFLKWKSKHLIIIKHLSIKMEKEHGGYHEL